MNKIAVDNINNLLNINDESKFMFNGKELILDRESKDIEYGLYCTFNELFYIINNTSKNRNIILRNINDALDNLYDNEQFSNLVDDNDNLKNMMDELCDKTDFLTEKYMHRGLCSIFMDEIFNRCILYSKSIVNRQYWLIDFTKKSDVGEESSESEEEEDGFIKED